MKTGSVLLAVFWSLVLGMESNGWAASGTVMFLSTTKSGSVIDGRTGLPVEPGRVVAGLYATANLDAGPEDPLELVATTPVSANPQLPGVFLGGTVSVPGTAPGQPVLLQIKVWPVGFNSYEEALGSLADPLAQSELLGPVKLGGGLQPSPSTSTLLLTNLVLRYTGANDPPEAASAAFTAFENHTFSGQLTGNDYDGDPLTFSLISAPIHGSVVIEPNGHFVYQPPPDWRGTVWFTFKVNDGELDSQAATVTVRVIERFGQIFFRNGPTNLVLDSRTGLAVAPGVAVAGLFLSTNLNAVPNLSLPRDAFRQVAVAPVSLGSDLTLWGLFDAGLIDLAEISLEQPVLLQVRIWGSQFATYEQAVNNPQAFVAASEVLGPLTLGAPGLPVPVLADLPGLLPMTLAMVSGNDPPEVHDTTFTTTNALYLAGQLSAFDPEGDPLTFILVTRPGCGLFQFLPDGQFAFQPCTGYNTTYSFTFKVTDGSLTSAVATASLQFSVLNGTILFNNDTSTRVLDSRTGQPVAPDVAVAGLYVSTNLNALVDPNLPNEDFVLVATTPISPQVTESAWGFFDGGALKVPGTVPARLVLLQVRAWTRGLATYEEALQTPGTVVAASASIGPVALGVVSQPPLSLVQAGLTQMLLAPVPQNLPPRGFDQKFVAYDDTPLSGQLPARDYDDEDMLSFYLVTAPTLGTVAVEPDGTFLYQPRLGSVGSDSFTFTASDGNLTSPVTTVLIRLISHQEQGRIIFNNSSANRVIDSWTGLPAAPGMALAGLYVSTNLDAQPEPDLPTDAFELVATAPVSPMTNSAFWGLFQGGSIGVPNTRPGQAVLVQVRVWNAAFGSYAEALQEAEPFVALSNPLGPVILGGGGLPETKLGQSTNLATLTLRFLRGSHPPVVRDSALSGPADTEFSGRLKGIDPDGDALTFTLASPPSLGTATVAPDGSFTYRSLVNSSATDSFTFQASDGTLASAPGTVSILLLASPTYGQFLNFVNTSSKPVIDGRTGLPVAAGVAVAGLYFSTNLSAVPNLSVPQDDFQLAAVAPVSAPLPGVYFGGRIYILTPVDRVAVQIRVWPVEYVSYAEAVENRAELLGGSNVMPFGFSSGAPPAATVALYVESIILGQPPGNHPPAAQDCTFTGLEDVPLTGRLPAIDLDGDAISFTQLSGVALGKLTVQPNGLFTYHPGPELSGTDSFTFMVKDGATTSPPATIRVQIAPVNDPPSVLPQIAPRSSLFDPNLTPAVISPNNSNALVLLDGSLSSDIESDPLSYAWFSGSDLVPLASSAAAQVEFDVGTHDIILLVDDGQDTATAQVTLEVVTPGAAVEQLIARIQAADLEVNRKKSLLASLEAALASFDRDQFQAGLNQLGAFLEKLRSQVAPQAPLLADEWAELTREIMGSISAAAERDPRIIPPRGPAQDPSTPGRASR